MGSGGAVDRLGGMAVWLRHGCCLRSNCGVFRAGAKRLFGSLCQKHDGKRIFLNRGKQNDFLSRLRHGSLKLWDHFAAA
jgi:hypothetical protein